MTPDNAFERTVKHVGRVWPRHGGGGRPLSSVARRHMVFALDRDDGGLLAFPSTVEAASHCKGIDVKDGFWLFFADDGSPLEARFEQRNQSGDSAEGPGGYSLHRAMSGLWLQERLAQVLTVKGCGLMTVAELVETLRNNRGKRAAGNAGRG